MPDGLDVPGLNPNPWRPHHMPIHAGGRPFLAVMLGLSLVVGITPARAEVASAGPEGSSPLRVQISATGAARVAGDHETVTVTVTNTGSTPQQDVLVLLSLVDVTGSLATPLGLEDWTPAPEAAYAAQLLPGASVSRTWRDRKSTRLNSSHITISYAV